MIGLKLGAYLRGITEVANRLPAPAPTGVAIYLGRVPQKMPRTPACIITVIGGQPNYHLSGEIGDLAKIVQVDVHADTRREANEISELIRNAPLSGYDGGTWDGDTVVQAVLIESEVEIDEPPTDSSDTWLYRKITNYRITYERTVT